MPLPFAAVGLGLSAIGGISKMIGGGRRKRQAIRELRNLQNSRQDFTNINEGRRISTRGADLAREEAQRTTASSLETLASGGIRGAVGGVGAVNQANINASRQIGANLDQQQMQLDRDFARDKARIQSMNEQRQIQDEVNTQAAINAAQQDQYSGLGDIAAGAFSAGTIGAMGGAGAGVGGEFNATSGLAGEKVRDVQSFGVTPVGGNNFRQPTPRAGVALPSDILPQARVFTGQRY